KKYGISDQTIYPWRKRFGTLEAVEVRRLRQLEQENGGLKKLIAERDLEIEVMKEMAAKTMVSARMRRAQVGHLEQRGMSQRRACALLSVARSALHYRSRLAVKDTVLFENSTEARMGQLTDSQIGVRIGSCGGKGFSRVLDCWLHRLACPPA